MKNTFSLSETEKSILLEIVQNTLNNHVGNEAFLEVKEEKLTENLKMNVGVFVTIYNKGQLRGCVGQFMPNIPLYKLVQEMAISASTYDNRFSPVSADELDEIDVEISVLTPLQKITSIEEIKIGRDGIYIIKGGRSGTLLPQVAPENNWNALQLLEYCSEHKTGIGKHGWKTAELFIYQAIIIK